jgi:hypothetical protein
MSEERNNLIIITQGNNYSKDYNMILKRWYYNYYYVNDLMPKYQFQESNNRYTLTAGYADDLPYPNPETRNDLTDYEGEYFYHLESELYLVDSLENLKDFQDRKYKIFNPTELWDYCYEYGEIFVVAPMDNILSPMVCFDDSGLYNIHNELIDYPVVILFSLIKMKNIDIGILVINEQIVNNECWSTIHFEDITMKTCLNYFESFENRFLNPMFRGVVNQSNETLYVNDTFAVELFSFYTPIDWMPVCSVYRHRDILGEQLMGQLIIDTNFPYTIDGFKIYFDVKNDGWVKFGVDGGEFFDLTKEYIIRKVDKVIDNDSIKRDIHPEGFNHYDFR